jgi:hypothetical protein
MSSTNRSEARKSHIADYYVTPVMPIVQFLEIWQRTNNIKSMGRILDPCSGGDWKNSMSYPTAIALSGIYYQSMTTVDIRKDSRAGCIENYLERMYEPKYETIISNPPFNLALQFIEHSFLNIQDDGWIIMLLRLNFFGSTLRKKFWENHMPTCCYIHSRRMSFTDKKGTDSIEYMHACWNMAEPPGESTKLFII